MGETLAAVIGGVIGGLVGGFFSWVIAKKQIEEAKRLADSETRRERIWEIASAVAVIQSEILSPSTLNVLKSVNDVDRLKQEWDQIAKQMSILDHRAMEREFSACLDPYLDLLRDFVKHKVERTQIDYQRREARDRVTRIMRSFTRG
jgi:hypothetical protein